MILYDIDACLGRYLCIGKYRYTRISLIYVMVVMGIKHWHQNHDQGYGRIWRYIKIFKDCIQG